MSPLKCAVGVFPHKLLRFTVHRKEVDLNPSKGKDVQDIELPKMCKQMKSFIGRVSMIVDLIQHWLSSFMGRVSKKDVSSSCGEVQQQSSSSVHL